MMKTHPMAARHGYLFSEMHSELDAFLKVGEPRKGLSLFNVRFNRFGQLRMARPCPRCMKWCIDSFDEIWYTTEDGIVLHGTPSFLIHKEVATEKCKHEKVHSIS